MPSIAGGARQLTAVICLVGMLSWGLVAAVSVSAADTEIRVAVCSNGQAPTTLTIDEPSDGTVVQNSSVTIMGSVSQATQITVEIDGVYSGTIPLSAGQTSYEQSVSIAEGQHEVTLTANDVCQRQDATESITVTYQPLPGTVVEPPAPPTPHDPQGEIGGGVRITAAPDSPAASSGGLVPWVTDTMETVAHALDFDATAQRDNGLLTMMLRFMLIIIGLFLLFFGPRLYNWLAAREVPGTGWMVVDHPAASVVLRTIGIGLILLGFII